MASNLHDGQHMLCRSIWLSEYVGLSRMCLDSYVYVVTYSVVMKV